MHRLSGPFCQRLSFSGVLEVAAEPAAFGSFSQGMCCQQAIGSIVYGCTVLMLAVEEQEAQVVFEVAMFSGSRCFQDRDVFKIVMTGGVAGSERMASRRREAFSVNQLDASA